MAIDQTEQRVVTTEAPIATGQGITQTDQRVVTTDAPIATGQSITQTDVTRRSTTGPSGSELIRRIVILIFGLIQLVIGLRFVLLLVGAREANGLVSGILNISQVFVAPFDGILRTDALHSPGSVVDLTAIVAIVGWTILEIVILWAVGIFRREPA